MWHPSDMPLTPAELRVLGALIEKEITTPENYPLSLNALQAAANQRSSRDPVLDVTEEELRQALHGLQELALVTPVRDSRVPKWEHRARTVLNLRRDETALLCLLLLRGPQTPGELRARADRLYPFDDLLAVTATLDRLAARGGSAGSLFEPGGTGPLTRALPRQPGSREVRYTHLLGNPEAMAAPSTTFAAAPRSTAGPENALPESAPQGIAPGEIAELRAALEQLRMDVANMRGRLELLEAKPLPSD